MTCGLNHRTSQTNRSMLTPDIDYEPEPVGDYRSDERQIMLERRYE